MIIHGHTVPKRWQRLPGERQGIVHCHVGPVGNDELQMVHLLEIGQLLAFHSEPGGGLLLHAALACQGEEGVALIGGSGRGKTTASRRIPAPWCSCCDDYTLVVRDGRGEFWAHPWPTWSRFTSGGPGGFWPVKKSVRLRAMFFLQPAPDDAWESPGKNQAIVRIVEAVEQAMWSTTLSLERSQRRSIRLRRLGNAVCLARAVPFFNLRLTLNGKFWETMDDALAGIVGAKLGLPWHQVTKASAREYEKRHPGHVWGPC